jgi:hypothetical protein
MVLAFATALAISGSVTAGGLVCLWRDRREAAGKPDVFARLTTAVSRGGPLSRPFRRILARGRPLPGDVVRVRSREEVSATLDSHGTVDGLPFMAEMESFHGKVFQVHRVVDKINDMRHKTGLRRMRNTVTLAELRCSGAHHGGCEAECQLLWKDVWLERLPSVRAASMRPAHPPPGHGTMPPGPGNDTDETYSCQMTSLWEASRSMSPFDLRQDLRPLWSGNIPLVVYLLVILTRVFNVAQSARKGAGYPYMPPPAANGAPPTPKLDLVRGDAVAVRSKTEIAATLVNNRNRGLWFDRDMVRFCGQPDVVRKRVTRIIHEATGKMVVMKSPCIVLEDGIATGEFLRLCPQQEHIFWREAWLRKR